jgi:hypothetical protein
MQTETDRGGGGLHRRPIWSRERLDALIADLAETNPDDPKPGITREYIRYLRVLSTCGFEEMLDEILNNLHAATAALQVAMGETPAAVELMTSMQLTSARTFLTIAKYREASGRITTIRSPTNPSELRNERNPTK